MKIDAIGIYLGYDTILNMRFEEDSNEMLKKLKQLSKHKLASIRKEKHLEPIEVGTTNYYLHMYSNIILESQLEYVGTCFEGSSFAFGNIRFVFNRRRHIRFIEIGLKGLSQDERYKYTIDINGKQRPLYNTLAEIKMLCNDNDIISFDKGDIIIADKEVCLHMHKEDDDNL